MADQLIAPTARVHTFSGNRVRDTAPPPRPPVASRLPVPGTSIGPPPRPVALTAAVRLWALVLVAGLVALILSAIDLEALRHDLLVDARIDDRTAEDRLLSQSVLVLMTTMALACDAVLLLIVWGLQLIGRRSYGALRVLVPTAVLALVAVAIAQGLVAGGATQLDRTAFLVQAGLIVLATGALLSRSSRAWLRAGAG